MDSLPLWSLHSNEGTDVPDVLNLAHLQNVTSAMQEEVTITEYDG